MLSLFTASSSNAIAFCTKVTKAVCFMGSCHRLRADKVRERIPIFFKIALGTRT